MVHSLNPGEPNLHQKDKWLLSFVSVTKFGYTMFIFQ